MPGPLFERRVTGMAVLDYLDWVVSSRSPTTKAPLTLPPVQRSALWRPRQILNLWRSLFAGMPIGSFYLSRPGGERRIFDVGGQSRTTEDLGTEGYDLLDGQQRTHALLLALDLPDLTGKCIWLEVQDGRITPHLTSRAQPFGFDERDERLRTDELRTARKRFDQSHPEHQERDDHELFDLLIRLEGNPPKPDRADGARIWPLTDLVRRALGGRGSPNDQSDGRSDNDFADGVAGTSAALEKAEVALILATPPTGPAGSEWLLELFDRIGAGGTPLSGPERLFSMYKHHVPRVHDAVAEISERGGHLMEPVEVARTAIRIATSQKAEPAFWEPAPVDFQRQVMKGGELRPHLDRLITIEPSPQNSRLGDAFASVNRLLRYEAPSGSDNWDFGLPSVMIADLNTELIRVLIHWAVVSHGLDVSDAKEDLVRFALFWHLCVTNDGKAAVKSGRMLHRWHPDGTFPWLALLQVITGMDIPIDGEDTAEEADASDPSALRLIHPNLMRAWGTYDQRASATVRDWQTRFARPGDPNTAALFHRWWGRSGMLLWLQRGYIHDVTPRRMPASTHEDDRPVDLDHIQPQAAYGNDRRTQKSFLPPDLAIEKAFYNERKNLEGSIGNFRWVPPAVNRQDGDAPIAEKLRLNSVDRMARDGKRPGARDGAMDPSSFDRWLEASAPMDNTWSEDRIAAWQSAVEERTIWLYERLWEEAGFDAWSGP